MSTEADPLRALQWLATQNHIHPGSLVGDADVMRALAWSNRRARHALRRLEQEGCITIHPVALAGPAPSLGHVQVSFKGQMRLAQPVARSRRGVRPASLPH